METEYIDEYGFDSLKELRIASANNADIFVTQNKKIINDREELEEFFKIKILTPLEVLDGRDEKNKKASGEERKMGKKVFNPKNMMAGALYDAEQIGKTGNSEKAIEILEKKVNELKKINNSDYMRLEW